MSKQSTRSKSKQGQSLHKPVSKAAASTVKAGSASTNGVTTKSSDAPSKSAPGKTATATTASASTTQKAAPTATRPATPATQKAAGSGLSSKSVKQQRKQQKEQNRLVQQKQDASIRRTTIILVVAAFVVAGALLTYFFVTNQQGSGETVYNPDYQPVDGVYCDQLEQTAYHHHVLLTIYIDGQQVTVPAGVGIAGNTSSPTCYYWLHTHDTTGIVHIEAPNGATHTLKQFLDVWQQFANAGSSSSSITYPSQLASSSGWTVYINGKQVNENFSQVDISSNAAWHEVITIMYNSPGVKPISTYSWPSGY